MWMDQPDARSDFVLAAAAALFGRLALGLVQALPFYPRDGILGALIGVSWVFALSGLVPLLLARYRDHGLESFGLAGERNGLLAGLGLALPVAVAATVNAWGAGISLPIAALGRLGEPLQPSPTISGPDQSATVPLDLFVSILAVIALFLGSLLLYTFLTTRSRDSFVPREISLTEGLRTYGMGAVGVALLLGLLNAIRPDVGVVSTLINGAALATVVLLADRLIPPGTSTSRAALLAPGIVALLLGVFVVGGGFFSSNLLGGLYAGVMAAGVVVVIAALVESRSYAWAVVPLIAAAAFYPSCLAPLRLNPFCF